MSTIRKNFTSIWLQQRSLIYVTATNGAAYCDLYNGNTRLARYTLNAEHKVTIDITDYMRAHPTTTSLKVQIAGESAVTVSTPLGGNIDPDGMPIPPNTLMPEWKIVPPAMMLQDIGVDTIFECFGFDGDLDPEYFYDNTSGAQELQQSNKLPAGSAFLQFSVEHDYRARYQLKPLQCGKKYAAVEWIAASGAERRHTFEVVGLKSLIYGTFSLQTLDNSYNVRKGREEAFELLVEGLTAYDLWYYSDILTSSSVKVSFNGVDWYQVEVRGDGQTIPNGDAGEFYKLSIPVNFRRYDAI